MFYRCFFYAFCVDISIRFVFIRPRKCADQRVFVYLTFIFFSILFFFCLQCIHCIAAAAARRAASSQKANHHHHHHHHNHSTSPVHNASYSSPPHRPASPPSVFQVRIRERKYCLRCEDSYSARESGSIYIQNKPNSPRERKNSLWKISAAYTRITTFFTILYLFLDHSRGVVYRQ